MANEIEKIDPGTGEIETVTQQSLAVSLSRVEIDQQISTALAYPRAQRKGGLGGIMDAITSLATMSKAAAEAAVYALPRGGKPIKGASVRHAESVASQWGNCRVGARVVHVDKFEKYVEAEGVFHDLETNTATTARVRRRIVDKHGRLFNDDMILVTGNAACSIAKRNAILGGVPRAIWEPGYEAAEQVIAGDIKTLTESREAAVKAFALFGVTPEQIFASLEVEGIEDINLDRVGTLRAMFKQIKDGEQTVEDWFPPAPKAGGQKRVGGEAPKGTAGKLEALAKDGKGKADKAEDQAGKPDGDQPAGDKPDADKGDEGQTETKDAGEDGKPDTQESAQGDAQEASGETEGDSPSETGEAAQGEDTAESGADESDAAQEAPSFTDDQIEAAFQKGKEARAKGRSRKAPPAEFKADDKAPLLEAWQNGFDE